ncbi:hypothetical protein, partial [Clostridioides difficile]|uniref:hypothetical protein n=1 Tax=Clostridioides difficile TaxID=1496 RepID=UPI001A9BBFFB
QNVISFRVDLGDGSDHHVDHYGGTATISSQVFNGLSSTDGTFEWSVQDPAGSHPAGTVYRVIR